MSQDPPPPLPSRSALVIVGIAAVIQICITLQAQQFASSLILMTLALWTLLTAMLALIILLSLCFSAAARRAKGDLGILAAVFAVCAIWSGNTVLSIASV